MRVLLAVGVLVGVRDTVGVLLMVGVAVSVRVRVLVRVLVNVRVCVLVRVLVNVRVRVAVRLNVGVISGVLVALLLSATANAPGMPGCRAVLLMSRPIWLSKSPNGASGELGRSSGKSGIATLVMLARFPATFGR